MPFTVVCLQLLLYSYEVNLEFLLGRITRFRSDCVSSIRWHDQAHKQQWNAYTVCTEERLRCWTDEYTNIEDGYTHTHAHKQNESFYLHLQSKGRIAYRVMQKKDAQTWKHAAVCFQFHFVSWLINELYYTTNATTFWQCIWKLGRHNFAHSISLKLAVIVTLFGEMLKERARCWRS